MRILLLVLGGLLLAARAHAAGEGAEARADALVAQGAELGQEGRWLEAVAKFREADQLFPRAIHHCNMGLAWVRAERWPEAQLALLRCRQRATTELPAWVAARLAEVEDKLRHGRYAAIEVVVRPPEAVVSLDAYPHDRFRVPSTFWVGLGQHRVEIRADGYESAVRTLVLDASTPVRLEVELTRAKPPEAVPSSITLPAEPAPLPIAGIAVLSATGAALAAGIALHVVAAETRADAQWLTYEQGFQTRFEEFQAERAIALVCYGVAAVGLGVGVWLLVDPPEAPAGTPHVEVSEHGVHVGWQGRW